MSQLEIVKKTKNTLHIVITTKSKKQIKATVNNWASVNDAIAYLKNDDVKILIEACNNILSEDDINALNKICFPTKKNIQESNQNKRDREKWFKDNEKQLDAMTEKMVNHPGFMSNKPF